MMCRRKSPGNDHKPQPHGENWDYTRALYMRAKDIINLGVSLASRAGVPQEGKDPFLNPHSHSWDTWEK
jgi:hypothetical protein